MPPKVAPPKPRAGQQRRAIPRGRIDGLGSPAPRSIRDSTPTLIRQATPVVARAGTSKVLRCSNAACPDPKIVEKDEGLICDTCGAVAQEESGLVSEQAFLETDTGRTVAQGVQIGAGQTHQRMFAPAGALRNVGRETTANRERSEQQAKTRMNSFQTLLNIRPAEVDAGMQIFKLAWSNSFVQGRTIDSVAVVCLYLACRRRHEQDRHGRRPAYSLMLIDFAERLDMDVFALGKMYTDLVRKLYLQPDGRIQDDVSADLLAMGPEVLVSRFVDDLGILNREHRDKIKLDAIRIVQRMKRDWMSTGRRPSGVCGAAIILASRMNNYRRSTREVVLTAKVTEITINKRLEEFKDTPSSGLSVKDFRDNDILDSIAASDPPSYQRAHNPPEKRKRGRPRKRPLPETAAELEGDPGSPSRSNGECSTAKRIRIDADGYKIPELPPTRRPSVDAPSASVLVTDHDGSGSDDLAGAGSDAGPASEPRGPGRPPGSRNWKPPPVSAAEIAIEADIENDIYQALRENPELDPDGLISGLGQTDASESADSNVAFATAQIDKRPGPAVNTNVGNMGHVSLSPTLQPDEFDDDPDVSDCLLNDEERHLKETTWVTANADWLRKDHAKKIKRELKEAEMRAKGLDPAKEKQKGGHRRKKDGTKMPGRRGDVSYLNEPEPGESRGKAGDAETVLSGQERERSAAESVRKMFKARGVYSRRVNYDVLDSIYGIDSSDSRSRSRSHSESQAPDAREGSVASVASSMTAADSIFGGSRTKDSGRSRSKASMSAEKREAKKKEQKDKERTRSRTAESATDHADDHSPAPGMPTSPARLGPERRLPPPLPPTPAATQLRTSQQPLRPSEGVEEIVGPVDASGSPLERDDADEGSLIPIPARDHRALTGDYDDDESEGDDDDYVDEDDADNDNADEDADAAFEGHYSGRPWDGIL